MLEIDDYNSEYFFNLENEYDEYNNIFDDYEPPAPIKDEAYNIFALEQAIITIREIGEKDSVLGHAADDAARAIRHLIDLYTEDEGEI